MSSEDTHHPHDSIARQSFSRPEVARDIIRRFLPPEIVAVIDDESLELVNGSFIDEDLRSSQSDVLYRVALLGEKQKSDGLVYLLFEHKSSPDRLTAFQILKYMVRIWEQLLREGQVLVPVIPVVVYHGNQKWNTARSMREIVEAPAPLDAFVPDFACQLLDLSEYVDEQLLGESLTTATLMLLKYSFHEELTDHLLKIFESIAERPDRMDLLRSFARYLMTILDKSEHEKMTGIAQQVFDSEGERVMSTIADDLRESGRKQGIEQGIEQGIGEGMDQGIETLLRARFPEDADSLLVLLPNLHDDDQRKEFLLLISNADSSESLFEFLKQVP